jgi:glutamate/aspartate transport system substrate-binding protein
MRRGHEAAGRGLVRTLVLVAALAAGLGALLAVAAVAQEPPIAPLAGTLKKVKTTGTMALGYRESSLPFSYLNRRQQPIGYSIDLCREVVEDTATELDGIEIRIVLVPVTPADRFEKLKSGEIDLECGSTTNNVQRRKEVAFSPIFFVAGTKLMVPKSSPVRSYRDLAGKTAVVTAGTTNEAALRTLSDKQRLEIKIISGRDHAQSLQMLVSGEAAAFASDDVLLYGFIATTQAASNMMVVGEYLSYDPYGLVLRRDDPAFAAVVERTFARMAAERRLLELYNKWFLRRLPTGETLNLPISPQLEEIFRILGQPE